VTGDVFLTADLDCTGVEGFGVRLGRNSTLDLRGFSILHSQWQSVECEGSCTVLGPGTIDKGVDGIRSITIVGVTMIATEYANAVDGARVRLKDCTIQGFVSGISAGLRASLINTTISDSERWGIYAGYQRKQHLPCHGGRVVLENSSVTGTGSGCPPEDSCADIESCAEPVLDETSSCGTSLGYDATVSWGACSSD
jgi:hypothetical protein